MNTFVPYPQLDVICAKGIVVTTDGRRFADEGQGGIYVTNAIAALDDPLSATVVFDRTVWEDAREADIPPPTPRSWITAVPSSMPTLSTN